MARKLRLEYPGAIYHVMNPAYLERTGRRPAWLRVDRMFREMTLPWIAPRLQMGTGASLSNLLSAHRRGKG